MSYADIARYYDSLFPLSEIKRSFFASPVKTCTGRQAAWLDIGCATGSLVRWLLEQGVDAWGVDLEEGFIQMGQAQLPSAMADRLLVGDMRELDNILPKLRPDVITCLGNVLPYLPEPSEVSRFFEASARRLGSANSCLIVQTVNFDRVLDDPGFAFPLLNRVDADGNPLVFRRSYDVSARGVEAKIPFRAVLETGEGVMTTEGSHLALRGASLKSMATKYFGNVDILGDFDGRPWSPSAPAIILVCESPQSRGM